MKTDAHHRFGSTGEALRGKERVIRFVIKGETKTLGREGYYKGWRGWWRRVLGLGNAGTKESLEEVMKGRLASNNGEKNLISSS